MTINEVIILGCCRSSGATSIAASFAALTDGTVLVDCDTESAGLYRALVPEWAARDPSSAGDVREAAVYPTSYGPLVLASSAATGGHCASLVPMMIDKARVLAGEKGCGRIIIDGLADSWFGTLPPPQESRAILIVTEPTPSGLHDLERIAGLAAGLRVKTYACVNRFDVDREMTHRIIDWCGERDIPMIGKIPFDLDFSRSRTAGTTMAEFSFGPASYEIAYMWGRISREL